MRESLGGDTVHAILAILPEKGNNQEQDCKNRLANRTQNNTDGYHGKDVDKHFRKVNPVRGTWHQQPIQNSSRSVGVISP